MSNGDYMPSKDSQLVPFGTNFNNGCSENAAELSLTVPELAQISATVTAFNEAYDAMIAAKFAYEAAVAEKDTTRATMKALIRGYAREFKANPNVSESTLDKLGIVGSGSQSPLAPVTGLTATGCSNGDNLIKFDRGNNIAPTQFIIEAKYGTSNAWTFVDVITATRYTHANQTPGLQVTYRVTTARAGERSSPCDPFVLYPGGEGEPELALVA